MFEINNYLFVFRMTGNLPIIKHNYTSDHWNMENGYHKNAPNDELSYPFRVHAAGTRGGLYILLRLYSYDFEYVCRGPVLGFKVTLHAPDELPHISSHFFRVPLNQETIVAIKPDVMTTASVLQSYEPKE